MINHGRTLLLNLAGSTHPGYTYPGEEYVPPTFVPVTLTSPLRMLRELFLGSEVDRAMLNYRIRQLMTLVHSTDLGEYMTALDPRITYWPIRDERLFDLTSYGATVKTLGSTNWSINVIGNPAMQLADKRLFDSWDIEVLTTTSVRVKHRLDPFESVDTAFTVASGMSSAVAFPNTPYSFTMVTGTLPLPKWVVDFTVRPKESLMSLYTRVAGGIDAGLSPFGSTEPYKTLQGLWEHNAVALPYRLGAAVVAWIYRVEDLRLAGD